MRRRKQQRGSALAELALLAPVFGVLLAGTVYFGNAFYNYNRLERAVHDAGRYASTRTLYMKETGLSQFESQVRNVVVYGSPDGADTLSTALFVNPSSVRVEFVRTNGTNIDIRNVSLTEPRPERIRITVTTWSIPGSFRTITVSNKPSVDFPYIGKFISQTPE